MALTIDLAGRVALVTGGARGLGAGLSRALLAAGADVVACGRTEPDGVPSAGGRSAAFRVLDVRDPDAAGALVESVAAEFGRLDLLVNNAGGAPTVPAAEASPRFHAKVVGLNLLAPLTLSVAANAVMQQQPQGGCVLMVSSTSSWRPSPGTASYGAAKAGLNSLAMSLAAEWAPRVRVNSLLLGPVRTEQALDQYGDEARLAAVAATIPAGRLADPDEVGALCAFLASEHGRYLTGALIPVHGGGEPPAFLSLMSP